MDGTAYKNLAANENELERAIEVLAAQRDHYKACIDEFNNS